MIQCRGTFIKNVIEKMGYKSYLEIGLSKNPKAPYRMIHYYLGFVNLKWNIIFRK